jgi:deoxyribodipyrimidine photolyase-related protein
MFAELKDALSRTGADRRPLSGRRVVYVPYDQLGRFGPLAEAPETLALVFVESPVKAARRPYHRQKLAFVLANQRQFALEMAREGAAVRYLTGREDYATQLQRFAGGSEAPGPLTVMTPAERELRVELAPLVAAGCLVEVPHAGWLTAREDFLAGAGAAPPWRMEAFYRHVRRRTGVLMAAGPGRRAEPKPVGGRFSFDVENRLPWSGEPPAPPPPVFTPDAVTAEVVAFVNSAFADHPGVADAASLPATQADAEALWRWARDRCLPNFGPYEDALSRRSRTLFHTRASALINVHRLLPARVLADALDPSLDLPIASREGFVRQLLGWREYVRHVHVETDGFRRGVPQNALGAARPLPPVFWGGAPSGLACLDAVVDDVWAEAWTHHIARLMVLANIAQLLDVDPRALTDWFWVAYVDAFDWVVEPNVLGMGTFACGDAMTTKPYISGAGYLHRMGDHCETCAFRPDRDCPLTPLYWAYLDRHAEALRPAGRMVNPLAGLARRAPERRAADRATFERVSAALTAGARLAPEPRPATDSRQPELFP